MLAFPGPSNLPGIAESQAFHYLSCSGMQRRRSGLFTLPIPKGHCRSKCPQWLLYPGHRGAPSRPAMARAILIASPTAKPSYPVTHPVNESPPIWPPRTGEAETEPSLPPPPLPHRALWMHLGYPLAQLAGSHPLASIHPTRPSDH